MANKFKNVIEEFKWRESLKDLTTGADQELINGKITCYNGFDPTAKSLHIGNLIPILGLQRLQNYGHTPIVIIGGGTGMIGDPSGRSDERKLLSMDQIQQNLMGIKTQLEKFLDFNNKKNPAKIINNAEWLNEINLIEFLRETGKFFNINNMIGEFEYDFISNLSKVTELGEPSLLRIESIDIDQIKSLRKFLNKALK